MGLFEKKRSVSMLSANDVDTIRRELNSMLAIANSYDHIMANSGLLVISLEGRMRGDLLAFMLYLSGADKAIKLQEIQVVNRIFDIDLSHVDFELFRRDVANRYFEQAVPPSALILKELGKRLQAERETSGEQGPTTPKGAQASDISRALCADLVNVYALIGSALISADGEVSEQESADLIRYVRMVNASVQGAGADLPEGAAQRVVQAHARLFGKAPR